MSNDKKILYIFASSLLVLLSILLFVPYEILRYILAVSILTYTILIFIFIKKRSIVSIYYKQVLYLLIVIGLVYLMIYYLSGIKFGFVGAKHIMSLKVVIEFILPLTVILISSELIRYVLLSQNNKVINIISILCNILIDFMLVSNIFLFTNFNTFVDAVGIILLPSIISNYLYHNLSKNYGSMPNIAFRLITTLYLYIIPVVPATPDSLMALFKLLSPLLILWFIRLLYEKRNRNAVEKQTKIGNVILGVTITFMVFFIMLISNQFKFGSIVIATNSMNGEIDTGDVIIYERLEKDAIISINDIVVFKKDDALIVHRVVDIKNIDGVIRYYTKGDANDEMDPGFITRSNIVGTTDLKIPYIGYPSLWLRELFK